MPLAPDTGRAEKSRLADVWAAVASWVALLVGIVAVSVVTDNIPFGGIESLYAAGGRTALRAFALGVPVSLSAMLWAVALLLGQIKFRKSPFLWWMGALYVLILISTALAINPDIAVFGYWYSEQGLLMWTLYFLVAFLASQLVTSNERLIQLLATVVGAGAYVGVFGLLEVAGVRPLSSQAPEWFYERGASTMMNPDFLGTFLVAPTLLGVGLTVALKGWKRYLTAVATLICLTSLMFSLTRGAWLGVAVGLVSLSIGAVVIHYLAARRKALEPTSGVGYVPVHGRHHYPAATVTTVALIWAVILVAIVSIVFLVPGGERIVGRVQDSFQDSGELAGTLSGRIPIWGEVWAATLENPLVGAGPDNMMFAWQKVATEDYFRYSGATATLNSAHNVYLDLAVEFGIPYAVLFIVGALLLVLTTVLALQRSAKAAPFTAWEVVSLPITAFGLGASFVVGMTVVPILVVAFVVVGATVAVGSRSAGDLRKPTRYGVVAVTAVVALALFGWGWQSGMSAIVGNQATSDPQVRVQRNLAALKKAPWRIFPQIDMAAAADVAADDQLRALGLSRADVWVRLLASDPDRSLHYCNAGTYYLLSEMDAGRALALADTSLELQPVNAPARLLKGDALCAMGDYEAGLAELAEAVRIESCARPILSWEAPWDVYLTRLLEAAPTNPAAAAAAESTFAAFEARFPASGQLESLRAQVDALN